MPFIAYDLSLDLVRCLRTPLIALAQRDASLADQLRRAAASIPLNLAEGRSRAGKDRLHAWRIASGSARELVAGLHVAEAWGHLAAPDIAAPLASCDRLLGMLWRLTH